jgi:predicted phage terminase large subunit-like protein
MDAGRNVWVLDAYADRINVFAFVDVLIDFYERYPQALTVGIEAGPLREAIMPVLEQRMIERGVFLPLADKKEMRPMVSKEIRARPMQGIIQTQRFWLPSQRRPWVDKLIRQMRRFPQSSEDDMVDACAWSIRLLLARGVPQRPVRRAPQDSWKLRLKKLARGSRTYMGA